MSISVFGVFNRPPAVPRIPLTIRCVDEGPCVTDSKSHCESVDCSPSSNNDALAPTRPFELHLVFPSERQPRSACATNPYHGC